MIIEKDKVVSLTYELRADAEDGKIIESLDSANPLVFLYGSGKLLKRFEENLTGLKKGEKFSFNIICKDAYGELDKTAVVDVPISAFEIEGKIDENMIRVGQKIPMQDNHGNRLNGIILEITDKNVKMDFNHPLTGCDLFFKGEITDIRLASKEELSDGLAAHCNCGNTGGCGEHGCS